MLQRCASLKIVVANRLVYRRLNAVNWPFPNCLKPLFESEATCGIFILIQYAVLSKLCKPRMLTSFTHMITYIVTKNIC